MRENSTDNVPGKLSVSKSTIMSYMDKGGTPVGELAQLVMSRMYYEIDMLQTEVQLLREARIQVSVCFVNPNTRCVQT